MKADTCLYRLWFFFFLICFRMSREIHIDALLEESLGLAGTNFQTVSVRDIICKSGQYKGLVIRIKHLIASCNWKNCLLIIRRGDRRRQTWVVC